MEFPGGLHPPRRPLRPLLTGGLGSVARDGGSGSRPGRTGRYVEAAHRHEGRLGRCRRAPRGRRPRKRENGRRPDGAGGGHGPGGRGFPIPLGPGAHARGAPGARGPPDRGGGLARPGAGTRALGRAGRGLRRRCLARRRRAPRRLWRRAPSGRTGEGGGRRRMASSPGERSPWRHSSGAARLHSAR